MSALAAGRVRAVARRQAARPIALFVNFLLIILAYYQIKPASRSLLVEYYGADNFPYVWIATALVLGVLIGPYGRIVARFDRLRVVQGSCLLFIALLLLFRLLLSYHEVEIRLLGLGGQAAALAAIAFYVFVDIFSVVLVEQFWSLANTVHSTAEGRRWYGFVGTGGLVGGVAGGVTAAAALRYLGLATVDLLLVSAAILTLVLALNRILAWMGVYAQVQPVPASTAPAAHGHAHASRGYLLLIAVCLLCAQLCQPVVEFQFIKAVEAAYAGLDARTAFISTFFSQLGLFSIGVNLLVTPLVLRYLGTIGGLLAQPTLLLVASVAYFSQPTLAAAATMKIADRGLSYSINRASKELLYIPIDPVQIYRAKAWIDMFGYRLFKVLGSAAILLATHWLMVPVPGLAWLTVAVTVYWIVAVIKVTTAFRRYAAGAAESAPPYVEPGRMPAA